MFKNFMLTSVANYQGIYSYFFESLSSLHLPERQTHIITSICLLVLYVLFMLVIDFILKKIIMGVFKSLLSKTSKTWKSIVLKNKVFQNVIHLIPAMVSKALLPLLFIGFPMLIAFLNNAMNILLALLITLLLVSIVHSIRDFMKTKPSLADKPLDSYFQVLSIFLYFILVTTVFSILTGISIKEFFVSLGAASAILMLVFKDTIMGFVASIQVSSNDMVRVGDWIEMPKYGADGTVLEINLNTMKVENFDKTITTVPTHYLISDSFKNWRGMSASGGRRIKRHINVKMSSVTFLNQEQLNSLSDIKLISNHIQNKQIEINSYNQKHDLLNGNPVNARHLTNLGLFREYALAYIKNHPSVHQQYYIMVRQLQPTEHGIPLELYLFTNNTNWAVYEGVMSDIFDHLIASAPFFFLEIYELPSSGDMKQFLNHSK